MEHREFLARSQQQKQPKKKQTQETNSPLLFELPADPHPEPTIKPLRDPIWTENKAKLIERYLFYFVLVTKHGTYIDGFAGPQEPNKPDMWAAKLVLESKPRWFKNFYLFENDKKNFAQLEALKASQSGTPKRTIDIFLGDFN